MIKDGVAEVRAELIRKLEAGEFVTDKTGVKCVEIINAAFIADEPVIFGKLTEYADRELAWYKSCSLYVDDIPGKVPDIWVKVSSETGRINSNYGWCIWSAENNFQYFNCLEALKADKDTRRACMIYIRPSMQTEYNEDGMSDFMCTYSTQVLIRNNKLHYSVNMRSNDCWAGYKNDKFWHDHVHLQLLNDLREKYPNLELGDMHWAAGSLHVYERQFYLLEHYAKTGEISIDKDEYAALYQMT